MKRTILDVVRERSVEEGDCWLWTGYCNNGTPCTSTGGKGSTVVRLMAIRLGMNVTGKVAYMKCGNRMCVNPKHVAVTTKVALADRNLRASTKTLNWKVKQLRAVQSKSKLNRDDVRTIRNTDGVSQTELARRYGVSRRAIQRILSDEGWKEPTSAMGMMAMQLR